MIPILRDGNLTMVVDMMVAVDGGIVSEVGVTTLRHQRVQEPRVGVGRGGVSACLLAIPFRRLFRHHSRCDKSQLHWGTIQQYERAGGMNNTTGDDYCADAMTSTRLQLDCSTQGEVKMVDLRRQSLQSRVLGRCCSAYACIGLVQRRP